MEKKAALPNAGVAVDEYTDDVLEPEMVIKRWVAKISTFCGRQAIPNTRSPSVAILALCRQALPSLLSSVHRATPGSPTNANSARPVAQISTSRPGTFSSTLSANRARRSRAGRKATAPRRARRIRRRERGRSLATPGGFRGADSANESRRNPLHIVYGPEYALPENLNRLRERAVAGKRRLAMQEFTLGLEALNRFVERAPLRAVHECVFGVLALESEPIDPRL